MARRDRAGATAQSDSPAIRLLDAMRTGDDAGVLAVCGETTTVSAENMGWSCRGRDEIHAMLDEIRERFPDLTFESRTRHVGFGLVIDEARVQDLREDDEVAEGGEEKAAEAPAADDTAARHAAEPDVHPMWDEPVAEKRAGLTLWRETYADHVTPSRLNMPVRVTVRHDDLQVHDVTLSFPAALLKRALGMHVDPFEMSLSEVQSAFIAPVGAGFSTYELARPELTLVPPAPEPEVDSAGDEPPRKRRRRVVPILLLLLAIIGAGGWWAVQGRGDNEVAGTPTHSPSVKPQTQPSASASASPSTDSTKAPTVTHAQPSDAPSRKPTVTLTSDLAFDKNSAALSSAAKSKIDDIAAQVKSAGLSGNIYVNGYTDNLGSAKSGVTLSRQRAEAVSNYLGSQLVGVPVTIVVVANGEKDPIASNDTEAGRAKNRRVTITLPKP